MIRMTPDRRDVLCGAGAALLAGPVLASPAGDRVIAAARKQLGVTRGYDGAYQKLSYPGGDVPRSTGVCADVIVRAYRDGLSLDLQKLVHEDMRRAFSAYPSKASWGLTRPDANIDHRRVLNLEAFWKRAGAELWRARGASPGSVFPGPLEVGDLLTWRVAGSLPHVGLVSAAGRSPKVIHNIGGGAEEVGLWTFTIHRAVAHYRWPRGTV